MTTMEIVNEEVIRSTNPLLDGLVPGICPHDETSDKDLYFEYLCNTKDMTAITMTFKDIFRLNWDEKGLQRLISNTLKTFKHLYYEKMKWFLLPDVDDNGNFHYHGVIRITKMNLPKFKRYITNSLGFMKLKYIDTPRTWYEYCHKVGKYQDQNIYNIQESIDLSVYLNKDYEVWTDKFLKH